MGSALTAVMWNPDAGLGAGHLLCKANNKPVSHHLQAPRLQQDLFQGIARRPGSGYCDTSDVQIHFYSLEKKRIGDDNDHVGSNLQPRPVYHL